MKPAVNHTNQSADGGNDVNRVLQAIIFAASKHRHQRRKDKELSPYINHPLALAALLSSVGGITDVEVLQAAILHDTVEDTATTYEELAEQFGRKVADVVMEVTDDKQLEKPRRKALQIEHAPHASREAALVKLADKICNLRDVATSPPDRWTLERRQEYFEWSRQVVDALPLVSEPLLAAFREALSHRP
jgi:guanosine-3',5'-bis(diphosphate) 3'-pyrophosphohydrolase